MKKLLSALALLLGTGPLLLGQHKPAVVKISLNPDASLAPGSVAVLQIEVTPNAGWHVYSAQPSAEAVYQPAEVGWDLGSRGFAADSILAEKGKMMTEWDNIMEGTLRYYKSPVTFSTQLHINEEEVAVVGYFDYMACDDEKCLVFTEEFSFKP